MSVNSSDPTFGEIVFAPISLAVMVRVSRELLEDSVNIATALETSIASAMAETVDAAVLFGTGSGQPRGINNMPGISTISMATNGAPLTDYSKLLDGVKALLDANAEFPTAAIMSPREWRKLGGLVDSTGQPLNKPEAIASLPLLQTNSVPVNQIQGSASNASTILLGNFREVVLGFRQQIRIQILKERYADTLEVAFVANLRVDIQAWHEASFCRVIGIIP